MSRSEPLDVGLPGHRKHTVSHPGYRPDIDGLRAIAVLAVVFGHAKLIPGGRGWVGVDIFFVISGYLISGIILRALAQERFSLGDFYARRIKRIFPALVVVLLATWGLGWCVYSGSAFQLLGGHILSGSLYLQDFFVYLEGTTDTALTHLWSLAVEEQYYISWPLLLIAGSRSRVILLASFLGATIISFALNVVARPTDFMAAYFLPWDRLWEISLGGILAYAETASGFKSGLVRGLADSTSIARFREPVCNIVGLVGIALVLSSVLALSMPVFFNPFWQLIPTVGACLSIAAGGASWANRSVLGARPLVFIGLMSYPLYLWHQPLLFISRALGYQAANRAVSVVVVIISVAVSFLTYAYVEKPLRYSRHTTRVVCILVLLLECCAVLGFLTFTQSIPGHLH